MVSEMTIRRGARARRRRFQLEEEELPRKIVVCGGQKNKSVYAEAFDAETNKGGAAERPPHTVASAVGMRLRGMEGHT